MHEAGTRTQITQSGVASTGPPLAALDEWMTRRGPQRALPHPRLNRPADFLFTERGRRLTAFRLRRGLDDAAAAAGLRGRDGQTMHVTPHPALTRHRQHPGAPATTPANRKNRTERLIPSRAG